ncbi:hypothetical protein [Methylobacterium fujisawaense]
MSDTADENTTRYEGLHVGYPGFDAGYYLEAYPDIRDSGVDPLEHFLKWGWREGRNPSAGFNTRFYLSMYPDVAESEINPLVHYLNFGLAEGRKVLPASISNSLYSRRNQ